MPIMREEKDKGEHGWSLLANAVYVGNAVKEGKDHGGWFVGAFLRDGSLRQNGGLEVKYSCHSHEYCERGSTANRTSTTLVINLSGEFTYFFRQGKRGKWSTVSLRRRGEYVIWTPAMFHSLCVPERSEMIVVRWPSAGAHDKIPDPRPVPHSHVAGVKRGREVRRRRPAPRRRRGRSLVG